MVLGLLAATTSWADCPGKGDPARFGAFQLLWENDSLLPTDDQTDRDYTNGLRFAVTRDPCYRPAPLWTEKLVARWCRTGICGGETEVDVGFAFGQSIYTPYRYLTSRPQPTDRPYAGHLFGSWLIQATHSEAGTGSPDSGDVERTQTTLELQLGWIGPHAYAEEVQNGWHRLWNEPEAEGWAHQLEDEPTFNARLHWRHKLGGRHLDIIPHWGLALGTVSTQANLGVTLRVGTHLARLPQFGLPQIRRQRFERRPAEAFAFVTIDGRYVAHDVFVDGGVFKRRNDLRLDPKDFGYDLKTGFAARWQSWTLHYTWTRRSPEFESRTLPEGRNHIFRSYALTRHWSLQ